MYQFQDDMLYADNINMFLLIRFAASLLLHGAEERTQFILLIH